MEDTASSGVRLGGQFQCQPFFSFFSTQWVLYFWSEMTLTRQVWEMKCRTQGSSVRPHVLIFRVWQLPASLCINSPRHEGCRPDLTEDGVITWHLVNATATTNYSFFSLAPWLPLAIGGGGGLEFGSVYLVSAPLYTLALSRYRSR